MKTPLMTPFRWKSSAALISPISDDTHKLVSIKDPTVVYYNEAWHVYATVADTRGSWNMAYLTFSDWSKAGKATQYYMDANKYLRGYHCAPQVFYFRPQKKWYLIYQSQPPTYSTADEIGPPENWSRPQYFYRPLPKGIPSLWIDYWVICDEKYAYMFSSGDDGKFYRCRTLLEAFPNGFGQVTVVMDMPRFDLFEGACVYRIKGTQQYLALIECIGKTNLRYYKAFLADKLDGEWTPLAGTEADPFAGRVNVTFGKDKPWTSDISHGELLRDGYDETLTIDPKNLRFLYQGLGITQGEAAKLEYSQLPWQLGLLTQIAPAKK
ncbi:MAG: hypothetical protein JXD23_10235 [Spirochaetales bacterium]|nr:hypothetical protein [Spirochaetales bacterium]